MKKKLIVLKHQYQGSLDTFFLIFLVVNHHYNYPWKNPSENKNQLIQKKTKCAKF